MREVINDLLEVKEATVIKKYPQNCLFRYCFPSVSYLLKLERVPVSFKVETVIALSLH